MSKRTPEVDRVDFLAGQVHALVSFALAAATTHREPLLLRAEYEKSSQTGLAKMEMSPASDRAVAGFQDVTRRILSILEG